MVSIDGAGEQLELTLGPLYHVVVDDRVSGPLTGRPARSYRSPPQALEDARCSRAAARPRRRASRRRPLAPSAGRRPASRRDRPRRARPAPRLTSADAPAPPGRRAACDTIGCRVCVCEQLCSRSSASPWSCRSSTSKSPGRARCSCASWPAASATRTCTRRRASIHPATPRRCSGTRARASSRRSARASTSLQVGDHVVTLFSPQCRECAHCLSPKTNICLAIRDQQGRGYLPDGRRDCREPASRSATSWAPRRSRSTRSCRRSRSRRSRRRRRSTAPACSPAGCRPVSARRCSRPRSSRARRASCSAPGWSASARSPARAAGRRADRLRRPLAGAPGDGPPPGRDRRHARRGGRDVSSRRSSR